MARYAIDANILINLSIFTPSTYHPKFWAELKRAVNRGDIVVLKVIANECKKGGPLREWLEKDITTTDVSDDVRRKANEISKNYNIVTTDPIGRLRSVADTALIAYAQINDLGVFTYEQKRRGRDKPHKIPDVCEDLGIEYQRLTGNIMKELRFKGCR